MRDLVLHIQKKNEHKRIGFFDFNELSERVKYINEKIDLEQFNYNKYLGV